MTGQVNTLRRVLSLGVVLAMVASASAAIIEPALEITASNDEGTATMQVPLSAFTYNPVSGEYAYDVWAPITLMDGMNHVARLTGLHLFMVDDPSKNARIIMNFGVEAGASETLFEIAPGAMTFGAIPAADSQALMSYSFTLAESLNDNDNEAWLRGDHGGAAILHTYYNGGTPFHESIWELGAVGNGAVGTDYDNIPNMGFEDIPVAVDGMSLDFGFTLTPQDTAEIQTSYVMDVPEPATLGLLAAGLLVLVRRR